MKLGVMMALFGGGQPLEKALDYVAESGLQMVELCAGNYPGEPHFKVEEVLRDDKKTAWLQKMLKDRRLKISALSCHGNPLHPDEKTASEHRAAQRSCILLAEKLGVGKVVTFSGCPGDCENSKYPKRDYDGRRKKQGMADIIRQKRT